jgi:mono/diheme cytochrome c family protein
MATFLSRIAGAAALDPLTYEEVEADESATGQALATIVLASIAAGIGASGWHADLSDVAARTAFAAAAALLAWSSWALLAFEVGSRVLPEARTQADVGQLLRTLGFSAAPGVLLILGVFPGLMVPVFALTSLWLLASMVVALRQALDYTSIGRAVAVCAVGWALAMAFLLTFSLLTGPALSAQQPGASTAAARQAPTPDGAALFRTHCATCHGTSGRGDGPTAAAMRKAPSDLTRFARENGGVFPEQRLRRIIDGRDVPSHGTREMPVWGITLRLSPEGVGAATVEARIAALVGYLQSIQERTAERRPAAERPRPVPSH